MKLRYFRIVTDRFNGYEAQKWRVWFPFWTEMGFTNTHTTVEKAEEYIKNPNKLKLRLKKQKVVKYVNA